MSGNEIKAPKSMWTRPLRLAPGGLFRGLAKLGAAKVTGSASLGISGVTDIVGSVQEKLDAWDQAGLLISRSLAEALLKLIDPWGR